MDFDLSEEQRLLKESVDGLLGSSYDFDARKKYMAQKGGWSKAVWGKFAEQGLLGLPFSEDDGGFGAGAVETMIVMEALGKALVLEPYLATVVIAGGFLRRGGSPAQKAAHIPAIIDGSKTFAFAQLEKNSRYDLGDVSTSAKKKGEGWVIDGEKFVVLNGEAADMLVVTARTKGVQRDKDGIGADLDAGEGDVGGMQAILGRIALLGDALGVAGHEKYANAIGVALAAPGARGHDQHVGGLAVEHDEFLAVDDPAGTFFLGRG